MLPKTAGGVNRKSGGYRGITGIPWGLPLDHRYSVGPAFTEDKTQIGYEISFTRHFYKPVPMRTLDEVKADLYALERETEGLLEQIIGAENKPKTRKRHKN